MDPGLSENQKALAKEFADGLFPMTEWLQKVGKYVPPQITPWRTTGRLSVSDLKFPEFLDNLIKDSRRDELLSARWTEIVRDPFKSTPISDVLNWRSARGLDPSAQFGVVKSGNALLADAADRQVTRQEFYDPYWPLLEQALSAAKADADNAGLSLDWEKFGQDLMSDVSRFWPGNSQLKSSIWCKQFLRDLLYCALGMKNPIPVPWRDAVLIELGENRRVGNAYTPDDVRRMVDAIRELLRSPIPPSQPIEAPPFIAPVGSPPPEPIHH